MSIKHALIALVVLACLSAAPRADAQYVSGGFVGFGRPGFGGVYGFGAPVVATPMVAGPVVPYGMPMVVQQPVVVQRPMVVGAPVMAAPMVTGPVMTTGWGFGPRYVVPGPPMVRTYRRVW
ncbi:hypothetical protein [Aquisphaera insulae]|uniref:hypothetical protein n=1 Tax=Aquisphaera insulae TaxID=2712864 RepID=UPI0013EE3EBF|nr:hypothetical protein [Aquisphaera insulae]